MKDKTAIKSISLRVIIAVLLFIGSLLLFSMIANEVVIEKEDLFDSKVFTFFSSHLTTFEINIFNILTFFGSAIFLFPAYIIFILSLLYKHRKTDAINVAVLAITSTLLMYILKISFARHRPELPLFKELDSYSFPSGHALSSFIFFSVLTFECWKSNIKVIWKWLLALFFLVFSLTIGISRIVLRYHYASDVLAGFCLGLAYVLLYFWLQKKCAGK